MTFKKVKNDATPVSDTPVTVPTTNTKLSFCENLWLAIKNQELDLFGLKGQLVDKYFTYKFADDKNLYLENKVSAAVPALETLIGNDFEVTVEERYVVVKKKGF